MVIEDCEGGGDEDGEEDGDGGYPFHAGVLDLCALVSKWIPSCFRRSLPGKALSALLSNNGPPPTFGALVIVRLGTLGATLRI